MAKLTPDNFVDLVRRSDLVDSADLDRALTSSREKHGGNLPDDAAVLSQELIDEGLITKWHSEKLLQGKYKGFFLGKYKLLRLLGTGGMSAVYLAEHVKMHRQVAIKVLPKNRVNDSSYLDRFYREGRAAAKLDHPNIVRAFDIDSHEANGTDTHYLVMEFVEGSDLQQLVKKSGPLDFETAANYIAQAAEGLQHAHENNLIHRDIKPANLLVDERGVVKILDMGLALISNDEKASLTIAHDENVLGTADYLAPEQALNSHGVDSRADLYSLGCTLYFLLTGHPPFPEGTLAQRIHKHATTMPVDVTSERPGCPQDLADICNRMMRKKAKRRYQSAGEVAEALNSWLAVPVGGSSGQVGGGRISGTGSGTGSGTRPRLPIPKPRDSGNALADTMSDQGGDTRKGLEEGGRARPIRVAKPLEQSGAWRDSGAIDLGIETNGGSSPSAGSGGQRRSLIDERREKSRRTVAPWWIWVALGVAMLVALVMMAIVIRGASNTGGTEEPAAQTRAAHPSSQVVAAVALPQHAEISALPTL